MDLDNKVNDLMREWIIFRDECLSRITEEDKGHLIEFDKYCDNMLQVVIKNMFKNNWTSLMKIILIILVIGMINIIGLVLMIA